MCAYTKYETFLPVFCIVKCKPSSTDPNKNTTTENTPERMSGNTTAH